MTIKDAMVRVRNLNRQAERKKGMESEAIVDDALDLLVKKGIITTSWNADGTEDRKFGIDRHIQLPDGAIIDLQVKSSQFGVNKARQVFPHVPTINVVRGENLENLSNRIRGLIQSKLRMKF